MVGVSVTVINTATGVQQTTTTNGAGDYSFPTLPVGQYNIEFRNTGFKSFRQTGLTLDVNSEIRVDATLEVGNVTEQVDVTANALQVETSNTQLGEVIDSQRIQQAPLNGRSYTDLLSLQPGVAPISSGTTSGIVNNSPSGDLNPGNLAVNGGREDSNGFVLNGATVTGRYGEWHGHHSQPRFDRGVPHSDELTLTPSTAPMPAARSMWSPNPGPIGSTETLFEFVRNTDLEARNFYSATVGPPAEPVWRHVRRPDQAQSTLLLRRLSGKAASSWVRARGRCWFLRRRSAWGDFSDLAAN